MVFACFLPLNRYLEHFVAWFLLIPRLPGPSHLILFHVRIKFLGPKRPLRSGATFEVQLCLIWMTLFQLT